MNRLARWPPYAIAAATFVALAIGFVFLANAVLAYAVARGALPAMPDNESLEGALDVAFGSPAKTLAATIGLNAILVFSITMLASSRGVRSEGLVRRLGLVAPDPMAIGVACLGLLGLTTSLDAMVQLLGLQDVGALADIRRAIDPLDTGQRAMFALLIGVGPGVTEELFFRGYLLNRIAATQSTAIALVVSSVVFGAFHFDPVHTPLATAMGFYLGLCMLHTRSLWVPIAAHTANNALATATSDWFPSDAQAVLLIPLGAVAAGSAITMLARGRPLLPRRATVW